MHESADVGIVRDFVTKLGRGDVVECSILMHPDIRYVDPRGVVLNGWHKCTELIRRAIYGVGRMRVDILAIAAADSAVKVDVRTGLADERFNGEALWTVKVDSGLVREVAARRSDALPTASILVPDLL